MGKLIVTEFLTLDGVMEDPGGAEPFDRGGWAFKFSDPVGGKFKLDELQEADAQLLGRVTYEGFAEAWPSRTDEAGFADRMNAMPKYVVSSTLSDPSWTNTTVLRGPLTDEVATLKARYAHILVAGSCTLVQALLRERLVDELRLMVSPILLGAGKRLFADLPAEQAFELASAQPLDSGALILIYRPKA